MFWGTPGYDHWRHLVRFQRWNSQKRRCSQSLCCGCRPTMSEPWYASLFRNRLLNLFFMWKEAVALGVLVMIEGRTFHLPPAARKAIAPNTSPLQKQSNILSKTGSYGCDNHEFLSEVNPLCTSWILSQRSEYFIKEMLIPIMGPALPTLSGTKAKELVLLMESAPSHSAKNTGKWLVEGH